MPPKPEPPTPDPRAAIQRAFTRQAESYARSLLATDYSLPAMLELAAPRGDELTLDLAAGTGMVSFAFAPRVRRVVAVDLTVAMLAQAAERRAREGGANVDLLVADVASLPFAAGTFDLATCRIAIHHFAEPAPILEELRRVLQPGAPAIICDALAFEDPARADLHNRIERIRDPSHIRMLPEPELRALLATTGFTIEAARHTDKTREFGEWTSLARTPPEAAAEARALMLGAIDGDAAGIAARLEDGELRFTHRSVAFRAVPR